MNDEPGTWYDLLIVAMFVVLVAGIANLASQAAP